MDVLPKKISFHLPPTVSPPVPILSFQVHVISYPSSSSRTRLTLSPLAHLTIRSPQLRANVHQRLPCNLPQLFLLCNGELFSVVLFPVSPSSSSGRVWRVVLCGTFECVLNTDPISHPSHGHQKATPEEATWVATRRRSSAWVFISLFPNRNAVARRYIFFFLFHRVFKCVPLLLARCGLQLHRGQWSSVDQCPTGEQLVKLPLPVHAEEGVFLRVLFGFHGPHLKI